jgi:cytochrome c556
VRIVHWLFAVGLLLFVFGLAFIIAGARLARQAPKASASAEVVLTPVASVKQIMKGVVGPAANRVFDSVQISVTKQGTEEKVPQTDAEWEAVGNDAAALAEAGNLIMMSGRAIDKGDWMKISRQMIDASKVVLKAVEAKSPDKILESGEALNASCDTCHEKYQRQ